MNNFKRDNWTNDEVIELLKGCKYVRTGNENHPHVRDHNNSVDEMIEVFYDFKRPLSEFGAMAYEINEGRIYHVGEIPPEMKIELDSRRRKPAEQIETL